MLYSVWNQGARQYDYYEAPGVEARANVEPPKHIPARPLGASVTEAAWRMPAGAMQVGRGEYARGRIASLGAADGGTRSLTPVLLLAAAAYVLWRYAR